MLLFATLFCLLYPPDSSLCSYGSSHALRSVFTYNPLEKPSSERYSAMPIPLLPHVLLFKWRERERLNLPPPPPRRPSTLPTNWEETNKNRDEATTRQPFQLSFSLFLYLPHSLPLAYSTDSERKSLHLRVPSTIYLNLLFVTRPRIQFTLSPTFKLLYSSPPTFEKVSFPLEAFYRP